MGVFYGFAFAQEESSSNSPGEAAALSVQGGGTTGMEISYDRYLDQVLGGWIGKSVGGTVGARFEGHKGWIEISPDEMFPEKLPPNDDLDLQVLWLKVLEEKGAALTSDDLAQAWLDGCWYYFNEYGIFRRNWRLGIHAPTSGRYTNQFWETGMGCPIRAEIWGYVFPGAPDLAVKYATYDGTLDHTEQSVGGEQLFAAMASMAFFVPDVHRLTSMFIHYLPEGTPIKRLTLEAFKCYEQGVSLRDARDRLMAVEGNPEACDSRINVPFAFLGLLYGEGDLQETLLASLRCGYDTDCTLATAGALLGQILGASQIPESLKGPIGDELVMGIQYNRPEMTLSALARDTARVGALLAKGCKTGVEITDVPDLAPFPPTAVIPKTRLSIEYEGMPAAAPGERIQVAVHIDGEVPRGAKMSIQSPSEWTVVPAEVDLDGISRTIQFAIHAPTKPDLWPMENRFTVMIEDQENLNYSFGIVGTGLYRFLGVYFDALPERDNRKQASRRMHHHFASLAKAYIPEPTPEADVLFEEWSRKLGRPALIPSYEHEIDLSRLVGLEGPYCAYLTRTIVSPEEQDVGLVVGNTDGYRIYLNEELVGEADESVWWTPCNNSHIVKLRKGENRLFLKLLRTSDNFHFTLGFREYTKPRGGRGFEDWVVDLADACK